MRANRIILLGALLLFAPAVGLGHDSPPTELTLEGINGRYIRLSEYRGKVVLVNFGPLGVRLAVRTHLT